jgi:3-phosphoshikimate 1-carboxyvinyltransferase
MSAVRAIMTSGPVHGVFHVPGSKSLTNRALVCASLAGGRSVLFNASDSNDSALMANGLNQLGILVLKEGERWEVEGKGGTLYAPRFPIPVGNAGTTLRFFLALASLAKGKVVLEGAPRMGERPNRELIEVLRSAGIGAHENAPSSRYEVTGGRLPGGKLTLCQDRSSQFLSAMLLVAPLADGPMEIAVEGPRVSESYVRMTMDVMREFGAVVEEDGSGERYRIPAPQRYSPTNFHVEPDASGASYGLGAAAITGGQVFIEGLRPDSSQGDSGFAHILAQMGCSVDQSEGGTRLRGARSLAGVDVDMGTMPDVVPTLAAVALFASTPTRIRNVAHLRFKESDRISALAEEIRKLGGSVVVYDDGLLIVPAPLRGGTIATYGDHRMAMTAALVGLRVPGVVAEDPECVLKSFPRFWEELDGIRTPGAEVRGSAGTDNSSYHT